MTCDFWILIAERERMGCNLAHLVIYANQEQVFLMPNCHFNIYTVRTFNGTCRFLSICKGHLTDPLKSIAGA